MTLFLTVLHGMVCLVLIVVVLLQHGKGADIGAVFGGGGSSTVFGSRGAGNFLTRLTTASALLFMVTSLSLSYLANRGPAGGLFEGLDEPAAVAPAPAEGGAAEGEAPAATPEAGGGFEEVQPAAPGAPEAKAPAAPAGETAPEAATAPPDEAPAADDEPAAPAAEAAPEAESAPAP